MAISTPTVLASGVSALATTTVSGWTCSRGDFLWLSTAADDYQSGITSGWTLLADPHTFLGGPVWFKVADGTETSVAYTIGSASKSSYSLVKTTGVDKGFPIDVSSSAFQQTSGSSYASPSISATAAAGMALCTIGTSNSGSTPTTYTTGSWTNSYTHLVQESSVSPADAHAVAYLALSGAGSTSTAVNFTTVQAKTAVIAALRTAPAGAYLGERGATKFVSNLAASTDYALSSPALAIGQPYIVAIVHSVGSRTLVVPGGYTHAPKGPQGGSSSAKLYIYEGRNTTGSAIAAGTSLTGFSHTGGTTNVLAVVQAVEQSTTSGSIFGPATNSSGTSFNSSSAAGSSTTASAMESDPSSTNLTAVSWDAVSGSRTFSAQAFSGLTSPLINSWDIANTLSLSTAQATATISAGATPSVTHTATFSASAVSNSIMVSLLPPSSGGGTVSGAAALNAPGVLTTMGGLVDRQAAASLAAPGVLTPAGSVLKLAAAALIAPGALAAAGDVQKVGAASLLAPGVLSSTGQGTTMGAAALAAPGVISTSATLEKAGAAALTAPGVLQASGGSIVSGAAALAAPGVLVSAGLLTRLGAASLTAPGSLVSAGLLTRLSAASLTAPGILDASAGGGVSGAATLAAPGSLNAGALLTQLAAAQLSAPGVLVAAGGSIVSGAAQLVAPGVLSASGEKIKLAAALLNAPGVLVSGGLVARQGGAVLYAPGVLVAQPAAGTLTAASLLRAPGILTAYALVAPPGLDIDGPFLVVLHPNSWRATHENPWDAIVSPNSWRVRVDDSKEYDSQSTDYIWLTVTNKWETSQLPSLSYSVAFNLLGDEGTRTYFPATWDVARSQVRILIGPGSTVGELADGDYTARVLIGGLSAPRAPVVASDPVRIRTAR